MDDWKQWALCWSVPSSLKFHFPWKNSFHGSNLQRMNLDTFLTVEPSQYSKECITFSWSKLVAIHSNCSRLETPLFLLGTACPSNQPKQCWALHQEQGHWFWSKTIFGLLLEWPSAEWLPGSLVGAASLKHGLKLELCSWPKVVNVFLLQSPWINCSEFEIFFGLLTMQKLRRQSNYFNAQAPRLLLRSSEKSEFCTVGSRRSCGLHHFLGFLVPFQELEIGLLDQSWQGASS